LLAVLARDHSVWVGVELAALDGHVTRCAHGYWRRGRSAIAILTHHVAALIGHETLVINRLIADSAYLVLFKVIRYIYQIEF
jgi:hypothetical protein